MTMQNNHMQKNSHNLAWYKVPVMWFVVGLLSLTVVSGFVVFYLAHTTADELVIEKGFQPQSKKQALPENSQRKSDKQNSSNPEK